MGSNRPAIRLEDVLLLAFDTATVAVTVALHDGARVLAETRDEGRMAHGEQLAPAITRIMAQVDARPSDLTDVAVGVGPGPFTGLRVGVVTALTLGQTLGLRTHGVCSLDPMGHQAVAENRVNGDFIVAIDARRKEIYWALFDEHGRRVSEPAVDRPAVVAERGLPVIGRGAQIHADVLNWMDGPLDPSAGRLAELVVSGVAPVLPLAPLYLRRPDATAQTSVKPA